MATPASSDPAEIPTLTKRRLQAQVIGPIYREMVAVIGEEKASAILEAAIRKAAIAEGREFAKRAPGGVTSMADFIKLYELWTADGGLEMKVLEASDERFDFDVVRCRYAETYREMGLGEIGHLLSCNRDGTFCQGYDRTSRWSASRRSCRARRAARSATRTGSRGIDIRTGSCCQYPPGSAARDIQCGLGDRARHPFGHGG
jgi:L-2-amino-thiazoline-4-carboxylic acid hydrolase